MRRKQLLKDQEKSYVVLLNRKTKESKTYIYEQNFKKEIERIKDYATKTNSDILFSPHSIRLTPKEWNYYYEKGFLTISQENIYEMTSLFIDIDQPLFDNYYKFRKALKELKLNNYEVFESCSGNIHLYIDIEKITDQKEYYSLIQGLSYYLKERGFEVDRTCLSPVQKTYLEGFRVLGKKGLSSRPVKELTKKGKKQTPFEIHKLLHKQGIAKHRKERSVKYAMYIIKQELLETYSGRLELSKLERKHLIPQYTFSRALKRLSEAQAIRYTSHKGRSGSIQVFYFNESSFDLCIEQTLTRKQNWILFKILITLRNLKGTLQNSVNRRIIKLCNYIKKNTRVLNELFNFYKENSYVQGLFSGSSGVRNKKTALIFKEVEALETIKTGERNQTLTKLLTRGKALGLNSEELRELAFQIHKKMGTQTGLEYEKRDIEHTLKWIYKLEFYNKR